MAVSCCSRCSVECASWLAVLLVLCLSPMVSQGLPSTKRPSMFHYVTWTPQGVSNYSAANPLVVELEDQIVLKCDRSGKYAYSNLVLQQHRSQYDQCSCMTSDLTSCDSENRVGYCATELGQDIYIKIKGSDQALSSAKTFSQGQIVYFISYANATNLAESQRELFMGGDCSKGLKLVVMVADPRTQAPPPPTVPIPSTDNVNKPVVSSSASDKSDVSSDQPKDHESATTDKDLKGTESKLAAGHNGHMITEGGSSGSKLEDWHIGAIGVLVGILVISLVIFMTVIVVLLLRRPTAVAPTTSEDVGGMVIGPLDSGYKNQVAMEEEEACMSHNSDSPTDTIVKNEDALPTSLTTPTAYPGGLFEDPLDRNNTN